MKKVHPHSREYYSAIKKDGHEVFIGKWDHPETLMFSEINQTNELK